MSAVSNHPFRLFGVEVRRALHRRLVWVLCGLALLAIVITALVVFFDSRELDPVALRATGDSHPAMMADWWVAGGGDSVLSVSALFLLLGGLVGGASVAGAEWRAGTVTTLLTWEPSRTRLLMARFGACVACAAVIALALQAVLLTALVPAVVANGSTAGVDGGWWAGLLAAVARLALGTGLAAGLGAAIANLARNTAGAIVAVWAWLAIVENLIRTWLPDLDPLLLGQNIVRTLSWAEFTGGTTHQPSPGMSLVIVLAWGAAAFTASIAHFRRIDIAGA